METLKKKLSGEYWSGKRWMAYDTLKGTAWQFRMRFFAEYKDAAAWCKAATGKEGVFRIRALAEVLAAMNRVWQTGCTNEEKRELAYLVKDRPLTSYTSGPAVEGGLQLYRYFPVL